MEVGGVEREVTALRELMTESQVQGDFAPAAHEGHRRVNVCVALPPPSDGTWQLRQRSLVITERNTCTCWHAASQDSGGRC